MALFANAKVIKAETTKGRKAVTETVVMKGLERFAAVDAAIKSLTAIKAVDEITLKSAMADHFLKKGTQANDRPANFKASEGAAEGSMQLKLRASSSPLSAEEKLILDKHKIPYEENIKTPEAFLINPAYTNNMELLAKVEAALANVDLPADFLMKQEEVKTDIVNEASMKAIFNKPIMEAELLLPVVTTLAIKPSIDGDFWPILDQIMQPEDETAEA